MIATGVRVRDKDLTLIFKEKKETNIPIKSKPPPEKFSKFKVFHPVTTTDRAGWSTSMLKTFPRNCWRQLSYAIKNQLVLVPHWFCMA